MASFIPRRVFPALDSLPRSYFLGHHHAGLTEMKTMLSNIDLIVECRDYRVPITSRNSLLDENLAGRERIVIYTKRDLGFDPRQSRAETKRQDTIIQWHHPTKVIYSDHKSRQSTRLMLDYIKDHAQKRNSMMPSRMMVVGMPNVGKSSLLNALRAQSLGKGKAAQTGAQPGITRSIGTMVKIVDGGEDKDTVYMIDTPGVFIPYVPNSESMLKLALCGCVKDTIISPTILADYLLFRVNQFDPTLYTKYLPPTNHVIEFLEAVARKTGRLMKGGKGGIPDIDAAALWIIQRWRAGQFGKFILDDVSLANFEQERSDSLATLSASANQASIADKRVRKMYPRRGGVYNRESDKTLRKP